MMNETKWSIDQSRSSITFKVRHLMVSHVTGAFKTYGASIYTTGKDFTTAVIDLWIDASSVETGDESRDEHLRGADFFDAQSHKQISFTSSTISQPDSKGNHEIWGELTMRGITKNLKLDMFFGGLTNDPFGNEKVICTVTGVINRSDWGLVWNTAIETGGFVVGDEINIFGALELTQAAHEEAKIAAEPPMNEIIIF